MQFLAKMRFFSLLNDVQTILKLYELAEHTAKCNGVFPNESCLFGFAPRVNNNFTISL